jgi:hypothetical protein
MGPNRPFGRHHGDSTTRRDVFTTRGDRSTFRGRWPPPHTPFRKDYSQFTFDGKELVKTIVVSHGSGLEADMARDVYVTYA